MSSIQILPAVISDHIPLSTLTKRSKAYWGYSQEQMALWDEELTLKPAYFQTHTVFKACRSVNILGYYAFRSEDAQTILMDNLFVEPECMGQQVGNQLMTHFLRQMSEKRMNRILLHSDPNAMRFYLQYGFDVIGQLPSSIPGRFLPTMSLDLETE